MVHKWRVAAQFIMQFLSGNHHLFYGHSTESLTAAAESCPKFSLVLRFYVTSIPARGFGWSTRLEYRSNNMQITQGNHRVLRRNRNVCAGN